MTLETRPTEFVEAAGKRFAYRRVGSSQATPLICLQHFTGTMDSWDPAVVNALAKDRLVIVFDNTGLGASNGTPPDTVAQMATDANAFISTLGFVRIDLLGFSLGGMIAQLLAAEHPTLVRKVLLVGTAPQGGEQNLKEVIAEARSHTEAPDPRLPLFFTRSAASQAAGLAFLKRASVRTAGRDPESGEAVMIQQSKAIGAWCATKDPENRILGRIDQPALIVSGSNDTMLPASNAYFMFRHMKNAQLILYPDAGHGALFQYPERFVSHAALFLSE